MLKINCGPQVRNGKSITAYFKDDKGQGRQVHLDSIEILAEFYFAFNIDFNKIYGDALKRAAVKIYKATI